MTAMLAIAVTLTSAAQYVATQPNCTNLIEGRVMGPDGDYNTMRAEDIAWLNEAAEERLSFVDAYAFTPDPAGDSRTGTSPYRLNRRLSDLSRLSGYCVVTGGQTSVVAEPARSTNAQEEALLRVEQAGGHITRYPFYGGAESVVFSGAPSLATATNAFSLFALQAKAPEPNCVWETTIFDGCSGFAESYDNTMESHLLVTNIDGFAEYMSSAEVTNLWRETETVSNESRIIDRAWHKNRSNTWMWTQKFVNPDDTLDHDYVGHWTGAPAGYYRELSTESLYADMWASTWGIFGDSEKFLKCVASEGTRMILTFHVRAGRRDYYTYSENRHSADAPSWDGYFTNSYETVSTNIDTYVMCWADAWPTNIVPGLSHITFATSELERCVNEALAAATGTNVAFFTDLDFGYFTFPLREPPASSPPSAGKGASWGLTETLYSDSYLVVGMEPMVLIIKTDFPATIRISGQEEEP